MAKDAAVLKPLDACIRFGGPWKLRELASAQGEPQRWARGSAGGSRLAGFILRPAPLLASALPVRGALGGAAALRQCHGVPGLDLRGGSRRAERRDR